MGLGVGVGVGKGRGCVGARLLGGEPREEGEMWGDVGRYGEVWGDRACLAESRGKSLWMRAHCASVVWSSPAQ